MTMTPRDRQMMTAIMNDSKPGLQVYRDGELVERAVIISVDGVLKVLLAGIDITQDIAISYTCKTMDTDPDSPNFGSGFLASVWIFRGGKRVAL